MAIKSVLTLCGGALGLSFTLPAICQDDEVVDPTPVACISLGRVRTTTIVDDDNILFYRRGGQIYLNMLDRTCSGLLRSGAFTYNVQSGARFVRLCASDTITVLEPTGRGFNCGLGQFHPISALQAHVMLNPDEAASFDRAIEIEPVEQGEAIDATQSGATESEATESEATEPEATRSDAKR